MDVRCPIRASLSLFMACLLVLVLLLPGTQARGEAAPKGLVMAVSGGIGPAVADFARRGLERAAAEELDLVILQLDTPGGLDSAMRAMIKAILASPVPVVIHVRPEGARAASAGTYLLYAAHVAAMAPATNLGAATPVSFGGLPRLPQPPEDGEEADEAPALANDEAMRAKVVNDAAAYLRALAARHGRNADWAEQAVRQGASLTAREALELGVIDLIAGETQELLAALHGWTVQLEQGPVTLATRGMELIYHEPDWRDRLLAVISDPNLAYILLLVGVYGLILEATHPGSLLPGVTGGIALLLAFYTLQILPVNYAGLALLVLGLALMVAEAFAPSFGILGLGGIAAFVSGSVILFEDEQLRISLHLIVATAACSAAVIFWIGGRLLTLRRRPPRSGAEELAGLTAVAVADFQGQGRVVVRGESWQARCALAVRQGQPLKVVGREGLRLLVEPLDKEDAR